MHKLAITAPPKVLIERYMEEIAKAFNVPFEPDPTILVNIVTIHDGVFKIIIYAGVKIIISSTMVFCG